MRATVPIIYSVGKDWSYQKKIKKFTLSFN